MGPGANFANILRKKHNLPIQFDIKVLVEEYATLEFKRFPPYASNIDGVTLNLKKVDKPQVFINSSQPQKRLQFTLAHELGHIIIPWHTGNIVENFSDINIETSSNNYSICESEADEFASELLLPSEWLSNLVQDIKSIDSLKDILSYLEEITKMSHSAIAYKVIQFLHPGFVFIVTNDEYKIKWSKYSTGTSDRLFYSNNGKYLLTEPFYGRNKEREYSVEVYGLKYFWYYTNNDNEFNLEYDENDTRTDNEILRDIVKDFGFESRFITSISSASATPKGKFTGHTLTFDNLKNAIFKKFQEDKYNWILSHTDCGTYIYKRTLKLLES